MSKPNSAAEQTIAAGTRYVDHQHNVIRTMKNADAEIVCFEDGVTAPRWIFDSLVKDRKFAAL